MSAEYTTEQLEDALIQLYDSGDTDKAKFVAEMLQERQSTGEPPQEQSMLSKAGDLAAEGAAGFNRAALGVVDFFGTNTVNALSDLAGSEFRVPSVSDTLVPERGAFAGDSLASKIASGAGEGAAMGATMSGAFAKLAKDFGGPAAKQIMKTLAGEGVLGEAALGAVSGSGQAVGQEMAGDAGGLVGAIAAPSLASAGKSALSYAKHGDTAPRSIFDVHADQLQDTAKKHGVDLLASDVYQPKTFIGNAIKRTGSQLGVVGTGGLRVKQQAQREAMVAELSSQYGVDVGADVHGEMIKSLNRGARAMAKKGGALRVEAYEDLVPLGAIPIDNTSAKIQKIIDKEKTMGSDANTALISRLESFAASADGADFQVMTDLRSNLISDIRAISRGEISALPGKSKGAMTSVKKALDSDMKKFARDANPSAADKWDKANKIFAEGYGRLKDTELKNIMVKGETTPEVVMGIYSKATPSELKRLHKSLDETGRENARAAFIADAFEKAGYTTETGTPEKLFNQLKKPKSERIINILFDGEAADEIKGIREVLKVTGEAEKAQLVTPTGQGLMLPAGVAMGMDATGTAAMTMGSVSLIARGYESLGIRKALIRAGRAAPGTEAQRRAIMAASEMLNPSDISRMLSGSQEENQ